MIIYRPHRGKLYDAMAEAQEFNTVEEMKKHIVKSWHDGWGGLGNLFTVDDIIIDEESTVNDTRIGWEDSKFVCVRRMGDEMYDISQCIGMCASKYNKDN